MSRPLFNTRLGVIAATVGSAVGLGNIWRFPYEAGTHGGGAFLLLYIGFIIIMGIPLISAEYALGRSTRRGIFGVFQALKARPQWRIVAYMGILAAVLILSFYSVVAGWTLEYLVGAVGGQYTGVDQSQLHGIFQEFTSGPRPVVWTVVFLAINYIVISRGVQKGIERFSNILMPLLMLLLLAFSINSLFLDGASEGLAFLFHPDFSKIDGSVVIGAMGQAFFSLSLGLGCMLTYASYFNDRTNIVGSASTTAALDTLVAIISGVIIFPAVFTFGLSPSSGPKLVFEVLPAIFNQMPLGRLWASLFFLALFLAAITSTISMCETAVAFLTDERGMSRRKACIVTISVATVLGVLCALSFSVFTEIKLPLIGSPDFFRWFDYGTSNILLPVGGMMISIFTGWIFDRRTFNRQIGGHDRPTLMARLIRISLRYICPILICIIFIMVNI